MRSDGSLGRGRDREGGKIMGKSTVGQKSGLETLHTEEHGRQRSGAVTEI